MALIDEIDDTLDTLVATIAQVPHGPGRAELLTALIDSLRDTTQTIVALRREEVVILNEAGWSYGQLAELLQVSRGRIQQLVVNMPNQKRPGKIEMDAKLRLAELRTQGADLNTIIEEMVPQIRKHRGGYALSVQQIADIIEAPVTMVKPEVIAVDKEMRLEAAR